MRKGIDFGHFFQDLETACQCVEALFSTTSFDEASTHETVENHKKRFEEQAASSRQSCQVTMEHAARVVREVFGELRIQPDLLRNKRFGDPVRVPSLMHQAIFYILYLYFIYILFMVYVIFCYWLYMVLLLQISISVFALATAVMSLVGSGIGFTVLGLMQNSAVSDLTNARNAIAKLEEHVLNLKEYFLYQDEQNKAVVYQVEGLKAIVAMNANVTGLIDASTR